MPTPIISPTPIVIAKVDSFDPADTGQDIRFELVQWPDGAIQIAAGEVADEAGNMRTILQFAQDVDAPAAIAMFAALANINVEDIQVDARFARQLQEAIAASQR